MHCVFQKIWLIVRNISFGNLYNPYDNDILSIFDGENDNANRLYNFDTYGTRYNMIPKLPLVVLSSSNSIFVQFYTDSVTVGNGFMMTWSFLGMCNFIIKVIIRG